MTLAITNSRASCGIDAPPVAVEVHISGGLPHLSIVGLPEAAVKESKERVRSALLNTAFEFPPRRITINLAPADLPKKDGGRLDLAIALGILAASEQLGNYDSSEYEFAGELALSGELRPISGILPFALATKAEGKKLIVPTANAAEAALVKELEIYPAECLIDVINHFTGSQRLQPYQAETHPPATTNYPDLLEVRGQHHAKRALEIAAAGAHALLMVGPPGTGKTMLASRLPGILPAMSNEEALATAAIHSICNQPSIAQSWQHRPFRAPHHTASSAAIVGGSNPPKPGEVSLAHNGVLFLDELPEFNRQVLEVLREPLESGQVAISRAAHQLQFPARFQLVAAMNPCPCGYLGDPRGRCHCTLKQIQLYRAKISGPLLDRIDIQIEVPTLPRGILSNYSAPTESSELVRNRVSAARARQLARTKRPNSALSNRDIERVCKINSEQTKLLENAIDALGLSARAYHRILKVARTIADLEASTNISTPHLTEAISFRKTTICSG